jgi:hypothetical protein
MSPKTLLLYESLPPLKRNPVRMEIFHTLLKHLGPSIITGESVVTMR